MREDLLGRRFTRLVAIAPPKRGDKRSHWLCQCDCGNTCSVPRNALLSGNTKSCGCYSTYVHTTQMKAGERYGQLTIIGPADTPPNRRGQFWLCRCDCGEVLSAHGVEIRNGVKTSCKKCGRKRTSESSKKHGMTDTRLYKEWANIKSRCNGPGDQKKQYHARGITYCKEWERFEPFMEWALANGYRDDLTIDRIDVNGNYCPENCRWITHAEQCGNTRRNVMVTYNGKQMCFAAAVREAGINIGTARHRYFHLGWSFEKTVETPVGKHEKRKHKE